MTNLFKSLENALKIKCGLLPGSGRQCQQPWLQKSRLCMTRGLVLLLALTLFAGCDLTERLRFWGSETRFRSENKLNQQQISQWQSDLDFNRKEVLELHSQIHKLVQTTKLQGQVSWKIAQAYMQEQRFEMASAYLNAALENRLPQQEAQAIQYDKILTHLEEALQKHSPELDLVFDAGLCYANSSRVRGWEERRFLAAVRLFEEMIRRKPEDGRAYYQLGLLYGKARNRYQDLEKSLAHLDRLLQLEDTHIPGRFARAHMLVQAGQLDQARNEYQDIQYRLKQLEDKGIVKKAQQTKNYKQAARNIEMLDLCLSGSPGCEIGGL